ncbi:MAG: acylphosphatase [Magnetococcales bacterium]|nr:acylphosphatase [Magnetococcales bacterium]MBF0156114.1 acylphosphatase [Magnetococcales bacterium]
MTTEQNDCTGKHLRIEGRVQGVWYRGATQREANRLGVTGWVRNTPDGAVEAEFHGPAAAVAELIAWCHKGPPLARVIRLQVNDCPPGPTPAAGFEVRH